jgi:predicted XRE-type DNA-binding protein
MPARRKRGTDNVLFDLGLPDAAGLSAKALLAVRINELVKHRALTQTETARITGMTQSKVSQVHRYELRNISLERLMHVLVALGQRVEIAVHPARRARGPGITVTA